MAKRNRKNGQTGNRMMIWGVMSGILVAAMALVYLGLYNTCVNIGSQIRKLEKQHAALQKRVVNERHNWEVACSPANMEIRLEQHGLVMTWPDEENVIRLYEVNEEPPTQYAYQDSLERRD